MSGHVGQVASWVSAIIVVSGWPPSRAFADPPDYTPPVIFEVNQAISSIGLGGQYDSDEYTNEGAITSGGAWSTAAGLTCGTYTSDLQTHGHWTGGRISVREDNHVEWAGAGCGLPWPSAGHYTQVQVTCWVRGGYATPLHVETLNLGDMVEVVHDPVYYCFSIFTPYTGLCGNCANGCTPPFPIDATTSSDYLSTNNRYFAEYPDVEYTFGYAFVVGWSREVWGANSATGWLDVEVDIDLPGGVPPVAAFSGPTQTRVGANLLFQSESYDPDDGGEPLVGIDIHTWFVDGVPDSDSPGPTFATSFATAGGHDIDLEVTDNEADEDITTRHIEVFCTADVNCDGTVDLGDLAALVLATNGPGVPAGPLGCDGADLDGDGDMDLQDFWVFQAAYLAECETAP
ncbi:MAG: hypothetical protein CHACPFDD_00849 [Phycisphaerae bacterium]|nr:hypothetical protein [Phycisphaerae bacterium]